MISVLALVFSVFSCGKREHANPLDPAHSGYRYSDTYTRTYTPTATVTFTETYTPTQTHTPTLTQTFTPIPGFIDDFEDGDLVNLQSFSWVVFTDSFSTADQQNTTPGYNGNNAHRFWGNMVMSSSTAFTFSTWYWGYVGYLTQIDIDPTAWTNISFYGKGSLPNQASAANQLFIYADNGDFFTTDIDADIGVAWALVDHDLAADFTPDAGNVFASMALENRLTEIYFYSFALDSVSSASAFDLYIDDLRFY